MKRLAFLSALFGGSLLAQFRTNPCKKNETWFTDGVTDTCNKRQVTKPCNGPTSATAQIQHNFINNECPVCGTMAEPYRVDRNGLVISGWLGSSSTFVNLTRCKKCNAAFWQDLEIIR